MSQRRISQKVLSNIFRASDLFWLKVNLVICLLLDTVQIQSLTPSRTFYLAVLKLMDLLFLNFGPLQRPYAVYYHKQSQGLK